MMDDLLTPDEAAPLVGLHPTTVRACCRAQTLPCVRVGERGGRWRIPRARLDAWLGVTRAPARPVALRADDV